MARNRLSCYRGGRCADSFLVHSRAVGFYSSEFVSGTSVDVAQHGHCPAGARFIPALVARAFDHHGADVAGAHLGVTRRVPDTVEAILRRK